ncbi:hypothetical protein PSTG_13513 [Puccinia striiformis f. sp. tritici PST-78]|uniref:Uncharacterized protein n=1 Tax=Puccinia striiformis f. sp. tritici PST-78 TaxID=1165861 RepID=A0A0L0V2C4_9BASI|nr:hypothetical protein PSTG_13513 [Puccinia striiformis f. sp. tritici PST-78]
MITEKLKKRPSQIYRLKSMPWYSLAEQIFSGTTIIGEQFSSALNNNKNEKPKVPKMIASSTITGTPATPIQRLVSKRNNEMMMSSDANNNTLYMVLPSLQSQATNQPQLPNPDLANHKTDAIFPR